MKSAKVNELVEKTLSIKYRNDLIERILNRLNDEYHDLTTSYEVVSEYTDDDGKPHNRYGIVEKPLSDCDDETITKLSIINKLAEDITKLV